MRMTLNQALERLYSRHTFGIKLGLDLENALLERLGHPERTFVSIHVAGTNGKGSVCAMLDAVLREAGYRTGLYTSPHLVRLNERMRVNGTEIPDAELLTLIEELEPHSEAVGKVLGHDSTFFEFTTALAFEHFRRSGVQVAVVEVGLGGRLDATNVVMPLVSVITGISLEHTRYLGPDIPSIAVEKAGIVKAGRPVVCGNLPEDALSVVAAVCRERGSPMTLAAERVSATVRSEDLTGQKVSVESGGRSYGTVALPLAGPHQVGNLATAVAALEVAEESGVPVPVEAVRRGISSTRWPARFQLLKSDPPVILDGAHNPEAAQALGSTLRRLCKRKPVALVFGMCEDKDAAAFLRALVPPVRHCWIVPIQTERNAPPGVLADAARKAGCEVRESGLAQAMTEAEAWARECHGAVCVAGSLYLAGEVLAGG
jgi:dihydrofolate synthase / folylpolyglutamate synthase